MAETKRLIFVDIVKGIGIFEFIIWHILRNFYYYPPSSAPLQRIVFSVTGYFVFSAGFLIGSHYYSKIEAGSSWQLILRRLGVRSLKLIGIVLFAGTAIGYLDSFNLVLSLQGSVSKMVSLFYVDRWDVPLQVLLAISLTLVLGFLIFVASLKSKGLRSIFAIIILSLLLYEFLQAGNFPYLWRYFFQGLMGIGVGTLFYKKVFSGTTSNTLLLGTGVVCCFCFVCIELIVSSSYPIYYFFVLNVSAQALAVGTFFTGLGLLLYLVYDVHGRPISFISGSFALLGKHSLFVYLVQIVIIDLLVVVLDGAQFMTQVEGFLYAVGLLFVCILSCRCIEYLLRYKIVKLSYGWFFR